jgi:hypothetical protein
MVLRAPFIAQSGYEIKGNRGILPCFCIIISILKGFMLGLKIKDTGLMADHGTRFSLDVHD